MKPKSTKKVQDDKLKLDSVPKSLDELFEGSQNDMSSSLHEALSALHSHSLSTRPRLDDLSAKFISPQAEVVWQFLKHHNKQVWKSCAKTDQDLSENNVLREYSSLLLEENDKADESNEDEETSAVGSDEQLDEDGNLSDEEIEDEEETADVEKEQRGGRKFPRSAVDDNFFSLAEMHAFLDTEDKRVGDPEIIGADEDLWFGSTNYKYEDFFGKEDDSKKNSKRKADSLEGTKSTKRVRFAIDEEEEEIEDEMEGEGEDEQMDEEEEGEGDMLMGAVQDKDEETQTKLDRSQQKLKETIRKLEEETLSTRSWELSGEVAANQREENALLETQLEFDITSKPAPIITPEYTEKLEAMIIQRIKDKTFDDVVRKVKRVSESADVYRSKAFEEEVLQKKSLSEVYEQEYQQATQKDQTKKEEKDPKHEEIARRMKEFFRKLDALSNFSLNPPEVTAELKVITNLPTLKVEEVGMTASTDEQLMAPEEVKKKVKGEIKAKEERTGTDKKRERRRKKIRQRTMVAKVGEERALAGQLAQKRAKGGKAEGDEKNSAKGTDKLKSGNFFAKLQQKVKNPKMADEGSHLLESGSRGKDYSSSSCRGKGQRKSTVKYYDNVHVSWWTRRKRRKMIGEYYENLNKLTDLYERDRLTIEGVAEGVQSSKMERRPDRILARLAVLLNVFLMLANLLASYTSGSLAIVSVFVDSLMDVLTGVTVSVCLWLINKTDYFKYPRGRTRLEIIGVILCSIIMGIANVVVIFSSIMAIIQNEPAPVMDIPILGILIGGTAIKVVLMIVCYKRASASSKVLAMDMRNDIATTLVALCCAFLGSHFWSYADPVGAIFICSLVAISWFRNASEYIPSLVGQLFFC
ncbi:hypothetical protein WR25_26893 isoform D [Diploscapter pachys]|uniref:Cation efflux protein transmembrane domain-containing protein n=1 Tax=Diploscapter pachys TaxID=2018661 RepID=A0A2A2J6N5_9BILA|nr:hypothetical protein WR25_26893 isoform C [Diploscapter pachys]PAV57478.1 hypothetical protein WR25_26893 isoform D [Diploscapter pachys]